MKKRIWISLFFVLQGAIMFAPAAHFHYYDIAPNIFYVFIGVVGLASLLFGVYNLFFGGE